MWKDDDVVGLVDCIPIYVAGIKRNDNEKSPWGSDVSLELIASS